MPERLEWGDDRGATMVEYGLVVLLVVVLVVVLIQAIGLSVRDMFQSVLDFFS